MKLLYPLFIIIIIICLLPLFVFLAVLIVLASGLPILYSQKRIGKNGKPFMMYKFRTMHTNAESEQKKYQRQNEADGPVFKIHDDPRLTTIGKFLSHTGLDELPQLYNVICGDMALIGPRPLPVGEAYKLTKWQKERQNGKPGIISPWILEGYHKQSFDNWMKSDIVYIQKKSLPTDFIIVCRMCYFLIGLIIHEITLKSAG